MQTLEQHPFFPVMAWATVIFFAAFTAYLALELQATAASLSDHNEQEMSILGNS